MRKARARIFNENDFCCAQAILWRTDTHCCLYSRQYVVRIHQYIYFFSFVNNSLRPSRDFVYFLGRAACKSSKKVEILFLMKKMKAYENEKYLGLYIWKHVGSGVVWLYSPPVEYGRLEKSSMIIHSTVSREKASVFCKVKFVWSGNLYW